MADIRQARLTEALEDISILGATGSIGQTSLDIIRNNKDRYNLLYASCNNNYKKLVEICIEFQPSKVAIANASLYNKLREALNNVNLSSIEILVGEAGLTELASYKSDNLILAIAGALALTPAIAAINNTKKLILANKEAVILGGEWFISLFSNSTTKLLPADSEHNAIFQLTNNLNSKAEVKDVILTASGGAFFNLDLSKFCNITTKQATHHPNWSMGEKITIDSATMANKGLELFEAKYLFSLKAEQLDAIIEPKSIVHAIVNLVDNSSQLQCCSPDMFTSLSYCLNYPNRITSRSLAINFLELNNLEFYTIDEKRYPAFHTAKAALAMGHIAVIWFLAINEEAVLAFLANKIKFNDICRILDHGLDLIPTTYLSNNLEQILFQNQLARDTIKPYINTLCQT